MTAKVTKHKLKISAESAYRERQLLLTSETKGIAINSLAYRNAINNALKTAKVDFLFFIFYFFFFLHLVYAV